MTEHSNHSHLLLEHSRHPADRLVLEARRLIDRHPDAVYISGMDNGGLRRISAETEIMNAHAGIIPVSFTRIERGRERHEEYEFGNRDQMFLPLYSKWTHRVHLEYAERESPYMLDDRNERVFATSARAENEYSPGVPSDVAWMELAMDMNSEVRPVRESPLKDTPFRRNLGDFLREHHYASFRDIPLEELQPAGTEYGDYRGYFLLE